MRPMRGFTDLTAQQASSAPNQTLNYCGDPAIGGAQCWYDNVVYSPPGKPDVVYPGWFVQLRHDGGGNNGRAFLRSTNAGVSFTDMTWDATTNPTPAGSCCQPNAIEPNGDAARQPRGRRAPRYGRGDLRLGRRARRTRATFTNISSQCASRALSRHESRDLPAIALGGSVEHQQPEPGAVERCSSRSLCVAPDDPNHLQGGARDNGTFDGVAGWPAHGRRDLRRRRAVRFQCHQLIASVELVHLELPRCELPKRRSHEVGHRQRSDCGHRTGRRGVLLADHRRSESRSSWDDLRRVPEHLADSGLGRRAGIPRSELPRVHDGGQ